MRTATLVAVVLGLSTWAGAAAADEPAGSVAAGRKEIWLKPVKVVGHARPILAVDVARVSHSVALSDLRQRFLDRIEKPVSVEPF